MKPGFVGLGQMGRPIAHNLFKSGAELVVNDRSGRFLAEFRCGVLREAPAYRFAGWFLVFGQLDHLADQQLQRPAGSPFRRATTEPA